MLYLASRSPRRFQLLSRLGLPFHVLDLEVPEVREADESPCDYVRRVARQKAQAGWAAQHSSVDGPVWVLGSDTEVVLGDRVYGKPVDAADAEEMLLSLAGRMHQVITAVALVGDGTVVEVIDVVSEVTFAPMSKSDVQRYIATGEPMGKAGAYAIQGGAERWISRLCGSYSGVMGLPVQQTADLLARHGLLPDVVPQQGI